MSHIYIKHFIYGEELWLLPQKCIFLPSKKMLLLADLHFGKVGHFRKEGLALPPTVHLADLGTLKKTILALGAEKVLVLGDMFHSRANYEWGILSLWLEEMKDISFELIVGNHDVHSMDSLPQKLKAHGLPYYIIGRLVLSHEPLSIDEIPQGCYNLCGHIHPSVKLRGAGRQHLQLPCFYFGKEMGIMPAFGKFTGFVGVSAKPGDAIFAIVEGKVLQVC
ncbi:ligase-associated DNA damage response endonuclease PdeM [Flammeovirgaceae bacterium SG7u.111]|nr:ligase-associated DNA damage response endonuclease PdeM [Flammeovirgaceae bacterium SG7u.132]WPO34483.1 ligase-associated DNA damage response endonuclease PdeM [Flammeovirgaceae bacterium SG7u.111]